MQRTIVTWCGLNLLSGALTSHGARPSKSLFQPAVLGYPAIPLPLTPRCRGRRSSSRSPGAQDVTLPAEGLSHRDPQLSSTSSESPFPALSLGGGEVCRMPALCRGLGFRWTLRTLGWQPGLQRGSRPRPAQGSSPSKGGQMGPGQMGICPARLVGRQGCEGPQAPAPSLSPPPASLRPLPSLAHVPGALGKGRDAFFPAADMRFSNQPGPQRPRPQPGTQVRTLPHSGGPEGRGMGEGEASAEHPTHSPTAQRWQGRLREAK